MDSLLVWVDVPGDDVNVLCGECVGGDWCNHTCQSAAVPAVGWGGVGGGCMRMIKQLEYTASNTTLKGTNESKTIEVATIRYLFI